MGKVIAFPSAKEREIPSEAQNEEDPEERYEILLEELEDIKEDLIDMYAFLGCRYSGNLVDDAGRLIFELQVELDDMHRRKFFSPPALSHIRL